VTLPLLRVPERPRTASTPTAEEVTA